MDSIKRTAVDWITLTGKSPDERLFLLSEFDSLAAIFRDVGHKTRPTKFRGYEGSTINNLTVGTRDDSVILVGMGATADDLFRLEAPRVGHCTRLDCAVDIEVEDAREQYAKDIAEQFADGLQVGRVLYKPVLTINFDKGQTVYFGRRTARYLLRFYDRNARLGRGQVGKVWRCEVQFNQEAAQAAMELFRKPGCDYNLTVAQLVFDKFRELGIMKEDIRVEGSSKLEFGAKVFSPDKTLDWLRTSVRPAIKGLIDRGFTEEVRNALGLYEQLSLYNEGDFS